MTGPDDEGAPPDMETTTLAVAELEMFAAECQETAKQHEEAAEVARVRAVAAKLGARALLMGRK